MKTFQPSYLPIKRELVDPLPIMSYNTATSVDASYYPPSSGGDMQSMAPMGPDGSAYWGQAGHTYAPLTLPTMDAVAAASGYPQVPPPSTTESLDYTRVTNGGGPPSLMPIGAASTQPTSFMPHSQPGEAVHKALSSVSQTLIIIPSFLWRLSLFLAHFPLSLSLSLAYSLSPAAPCERLEQR